MASFFAAAVQSGFNHKVTYEDLNQVVIGTVAQVRQDRCGTKKGSKKGSKRKRKRFNSEEALHGCANVLTILTPYTSWQLQSSFTAISGGNRGCVI